MRRRLVLAIAGVAVLAVVLFAVPLALVLQRTYRDEALLRLQRETVAATRQIDLSPRADDPVELPRGFSGLAVYAGDGRRIAGRGGPAVADAVVRDALRRGRPADRARSGSLIVAVPLVVGERVRGVVRAARDDSGATSVARRRLRLLAGVAAAVVILSVIAAVVLGRRLARPLERLAGAARRLGEGDFAVRAPRARVREVDDVAAALDASAARLDDLISRERSFSADASHQLRTPLAALQIELEAMELRGDSAPELVAALAQVERLHETIDTLLAVARDTPRDSEPMPLGPVLDELEARWHGPLAAKSRPLRVRRDEGAPDVAVPAAVLREILDVLVDNACRHGAGPVDVRARRAGGSLAVDVADEGPGVSGDPEAAFARRSGRGEGHGIGLALARSLAHAEGGRLILAQASPPVFTLLLSGPAEPASGAPGPRPA